MKTFKEKYLDLALQYASFERQGFDTIPVVKSEVSKNVRKANTTRDKLDKICKQAKEEGYLNEINEFMFHEDKYVRCVTAMYCLFTDPEVAEKILEQLLELPKPNAAGAQAITILEVWKKGLLKL